jgi:hypothetical protein
MNMELSNFAGSGDVHEGGAALPVRSTFHAGFSAAANVLADSVLSLSSSWDEHPHRSKGRREQRNNVLISISFVISLISFFT